MSGVAPGEKIPQEEAKKTMVKYVIRFLALVVWSLYLFVPSPLSAGAPTDQLRETADKVVAVLKDPNLKSEAKKEERRNELRQVIYARFDYDDMARSSLGAYWRRRTPEEQQDFVKTFKELLEKSYADKIESYNGEKVAYTKEVQDKDHAEVNTKVVTNKGEEFSLNYKLHLVNREWKVYDMVIENISMVNNYRSQFNRILTTSSYDELIRRMKEKNIKVSAK
jgi:phospholipid transport system substrate-binding protein